MEAKRSNTVTLTFRCGCFVIFWADGGNLQSGLACCDEHEAPNQTLDNILSNGKELVIDDAKGSDVQDIPPMTDDEKREHSELSEKLRLLFQECSEFRPNEMNVYWGLFAYKVNKMIQARVQAAAVEMRERCVDAAAQDIQAVITSVGNAIEEFGEKEDLNRALRCALRLIDRLRVIPTPTSALDAMLLKARVSEQKEHTISPSRLNETIQEYQNRYLHEREERIASLECQLAALTRPAPERKEK